MKPEHQERIAAAYRAFADEPGFACVAGREQIAGQDWSLSIPLYVKRNGNGNGAEGDAPSLRQLWRRWEQEGREFWQEMDALVDMLDGLSEDKS